ncbi:MAG: phenylalanine--tRNA ligase subunit beta [Turicibacter sp.]|nr:phenylalanine--tRNA ligase subunit beta [Turicibacter sp.]
MKIPLSWLKSYVDVESDTRQFMEKMTMSGSATESLTVLGANLKNIVVGRIESIDRHPNADKLVICSVNIGDEILSIVTGADNMQVGDYVPVAVHGAVLADNTVIKRGKLRGEVSEGMLCSIEELGYTKEDFPEAPDDGIYVFEEPQPLGADVVPILQLAEEIVEFELYSNRPDCYSVIGLAREAAATYGEKGKKGEKGKNFIVPPITIKETGVGNDSIKVKIENEQLCPRYVARIVKNVAVKPSPQWLRRRLSGAGLRPINNIVDITNYVMLEYGQPLHAFDIDGIADSTIIVRTAKNGENFTTLDGKNHILDDSMLVIADTEKALAIAGVMGGENSKVTGDASAVLFESANFDGTNVRLTAKKLGMRTDASAKFERGLDPNLALQAVNRAMELIEELECGEVMPLVVDEYPNPRLPLTVAYNTDNIAKLLGVNIPNVEELLALLDIDAKNGLAKIPTFRPDITCEADICEEVARLYGYDKIPVNKAQHNVMGGSKTADQTRKDRIKTILSALGYCEALTSAFEGPRVLSKLNIKNSDDAVVIVNPLGEEFSLLRTTPLNGILQSLSINYSRRNPYAKLFELTKVYKSSKSASSPNSPKLPNEPIFVTLCGYNTGKKMDFFDLKGDIEEFLAVLGITNFEFSPISELPFMHPGRSASLAIDDVQVGFFGELHPKTAKAYEIETYVYIAAIELAPLLRKKAATYVPIHKFPSMERDIALHVKNEINAATIERAIKEKGGSLLTNLRLFDLYQGKQIEEGYKSMAYTLTFRHPDRTLEEKEIAPLIDAILLHLDKMLGVKLRDR